MWSVRKLTVLFVLAVALCGSGTAIADAPYVTVQNANVRGQADVNSTRITTFPKGTRLDVTRKEGDWYAVSRDGIHFGYIWSELLAPEGQGSNVTKAPMEEVEEHTPTFSETDLKKLKALNVCEQCELSRANLKGANLSHAELKGANLEEANLEGANLSYAELEGANLEKANLEGANLSDAELEGANLEKAKLKGANLRQAKLSGNNLSGADLRGANFESGSLSGANLRGADLRGAVKISYAYSSSGPDLSKADLSGADLSKADFSSSGMHSADLSDSNLSSANLAGINLKYASLRGANLENANLSGANLEGAYLTKANLSGADLSSAILRNAEIDGAILCKTLMPWGEENTGCQDAEPIVEAPKTEKSAAKYKVCKKACADEFLVCITEKPDIEPEACAETANQCLYSCKDKFQIDESPDAPSSPKTSRSRAKELCMSEVSIHEDRVVAMCTTESCIQQEVARLMEECAARYGY